MAVTAEIYINQNNMNSEIFLEDSIVIEVAIGPEVIVSEGQAINDELITTENTWSAQKVNTELSGKANSSHTHYATDVTETTLRRFVTDAEKAKWNGQTTTYFRNDQTEMNAIVGQKAGDRCRVADDGDGKFAIYYWSGTVWIKDSDPDWENLDPAPVENDFDNTNVTDDGNGFGHIDIDLPFETQTPDVTLYDDNGLRWVEVNNMVQKITTSKVRITLPYPISGTWWYKIKK